MTREIKFRGKNMKGEWIIGDLLRNRGDTFIAPDGIANPLATADDFKVDPETVGQFTGLRDKNSVEIYEGDIVLNSGGIKEIINYDTIAYNLCLAYACTDSDICKKWFIHEDPISGIEVIGNIHDHPDLIRE